VKDLHSRLVVIVSDDEHACYDLWMCAIHNGVNALAIRECTPEALLVPGGVLAAL
jgi:hypothetical protein